ncbi:MAG: HAD-IA family hydrolase [Candidatus Altiarchaeota archaeon]|nr:HAD-IA family hydrolase [Candidatus Altiarchaeota archaeon]
MDNYRAAIDARGLKLDAGALVERKNRLFAELIMGRLAPMPGVLRLLGELRCGGVKVAVVSSSPLERVNVSLEEIGLLMEFDVIISGDCCRLGKPNPEPFLIAAERVGVAPSECVVVEDAEAGVKAGKAAGMKVVAVRSPNTFGQDLSGADVIVDSMERVNLKLMGGL